MLFRRWFWVFFSVAGIGLPACDRGHGEPSATQSNALGRAPQAEPASPPRADPPPREAPLSHASNAPSPRSLAAPRPSLPQYDEAALRERGIRKVSGRHLVLYTDLPVPVADGAPRLLDQLYPVLADRFGAPTPHDKDAPWRVAGHVMADRELFREMGLLPGDLPDFPAGISRPGVFWVLDQETDYYRDHLLLHEVTHCFMDSSLGGRGPAWFAEGNAELLATHFGSDGQMQFGRVPPSPDEVERWGRIEMVQRDVANGQVLTADDVMSLAYSRFDDDATAYAWSWALCAFLDAHPRYLARFRQLHRWVREPDFNERTRTVYAEDWAELAEEFQLFAANLTYGYEFERCAVDFRPGTSISKGERREVVVASDRGWQNTGLHVEAEARYTLAASGRFSIADEPRVWHSEAGGLSYRYVQGRPIGRLVASIHGDQPAGRSSMLDVIDVGPSSTLTPERDGTLYLRINDDWGQLSDNRGEVRVRIEQVAAERGR